MEELSKEQFLERVVGYMKGNEDEVFNNIYEDIIKGLLETIQIKDNQVSQLKERIITLAES